MKSGRSVCIARLVLLAAVVVPFAAAQTAGGQKKLADAQALVQKGAHAEAVELLAEIVAAEPGNGQAWFLYGYALHSTGDFERAFAAHEKAASFAAMAPTASYNAACALARLGRVDEAFAWLEKARAAGFTGWASATSDPDLASLRGDARFARFLPPAPDTAEPFVEPVVIVHDLFGEAAGDQFGWVARAIGDADGDGVQDFASTAPFHGGGRGAVYVYSGASGALLFRHVGEPGEKLGWCVGRAGDQDGDRRADLVVGAPGSGAMPGAAYVLSGADGKVLRRFRGEAAGDLFGTDARAVGDQDGDGVEELLVGAPKHDAAGADAGRVTLFSGRDGSVLMAFDGEAPGDELGGGELAGFRAEGASRLVASALNAGPNDRGRVYAWSAETGELVFTLDGDERSKNLGWFVSIVGDIDADGTPDVYASDWHDASKGPVTGRVWIASGRDGAVLLDLVGSRAGEGFGIGIGDAGDVDRDGRDDLVIGSWQCAEAAPAGGKVTLFSGRDGRVLGAATCRIPGDAFGFDATGLGDVDRDGVPDLLLTAAYNAARGAKAGRTYVVSGASFLAGSIGPDVRSAR